ncbi:hypothetical protein D3C79_957090 [compost metagenome]
MPEARRIECAGVCRGLPGTLDESREKLLWIIAWISVDLPAEKAIFRSNITLYIDEADYPLRELMGQHQCGQSAHGVADQVEALDTEMLQHL